MKNNLIATILVSCSACWFSCQSTETVPVAFDDTVTPVPAFNYAPSRVLTYEWRDNAWSPDNMSEYTYDADGRLTQWQTHDFQGDPSLPFDPASDAGWTLQYQHHFDYDAQGRLIHRDVRIGDSLDVAYESMDYSYDGDHRQLSRMTPGYSSDEAIYYYDELRRLERIEGYPNQCTNFSEDCEKQLSEFTYDSEGRLETISIVNKMRQTEPDADTALPADSESEISEISVVNCGYVYNQNGQISRVEINDWVYAELEEPVSHVIEYIWIDGRIDEVRQGDRTISFAYDEQNRLVSKEEFLQGSDGTPVPISRLDFSWTDDGNSSAFEFPGEIPFLGEVDAFSSFSNQLLVMYGQGEPNRYLRVE